eukprot:CAMPEP_0197653846 /NCGR_PEP_ID=MMETSP1338-20131121/37379_1 /TAXON_ID=43686 ORGANISM="Pelagodinium beii, Strain RCC1491" /NCGR_SAMPLE_ID=MMETSP1338 /ASSEMBLY_ACC=CAM_ASM_000754 /LENGTH=492 /DNA_ID=CAMNT_0043229105 /DNA_START=48 /DNA_END=1522 /DNA_ORIENTATION=+
MALRAQLGTDAMNLQLQMRPQAAFLIATILGTTYVSSASATERSIGLVGQEIMAAGLATTTTTTGDGLVDGHITEMYWEYVDQVLAAAALVTPKPTSVNDPEPTEAPEPYQRLLGVSKTVDALDTSSSAAELDNYQLATPEPPIPTLSSKQEESAEQMSVLPYTVMVGAWLLHSISQPVAPSMPTQTLIDQTFSAQCPMMMMSNNITITPPCNSGGPGRWTDSKTSRTIMRWSANQNGGVKFDVDSAVTGPGSVLVGNLNEKLTMTSNTFSLYNCLGVKLYEIEETITKVASMAPGVQSTMRDHQGDKTGAAVFYQYFIKSTTGQIKAHSSQYRIPEKKINFTIMGDTPLEPDISKSLLAVATRTGGQWGGNDWRTCNGDKAWKMEFNKVKHSSLVSVSTLEDLQVASAAVMTLLAYREENVGTDGFQHAGQSSLYWKIFKAVFEVIGILFLLGLAVGAFRAIQLDKRLKKFFFRLEAVLLPKRPHAVRDPP